MEDEEEKALKEKEMTPESGITGTHKRGCEGEDDRFRKRWMELYSWYKGEENWQGKLSDLLDAAYYVRPSDAVSEAWQKRFTEMISEPALREWNGFLPVLFLISLRMAWL